MSTQRFPSSSDHRAALLLALLTVMAVVVLAACRPPEPAPTSGRGAAGVGPAGAEPAGAGSAGIDDGLRIRLELAAEVLGPAPLTVHVLDGSQGLSGATVEVQGDMSHAGMQPVIVTAVESEPGVYRADGFAFTMAGDWFLTVTVATADGREATEETFVSVRAR